MNTEPATFRWLRPAKLLPTAAVFCGLAVFAGSASSGAEGPFVGLAGAWTGNGTVTYASGTKEHLSCRVKYDPQSTTDSVLQTLRCASDSYKFEINAFYKHNGGSVTGHWDELTMKVSGSISGTAKEGHISGDLNGPGFTAAVLVDTRGNEQTVTISADGQEIREVLVAVRKAR